MRCVICAYKGGAAYRDTAGLSPLRTFGAYTAQFRDRGACRLCADFLGRDKPGVAQCDTALPRYRDAVQDRITVNIRCGGLLKEYAAAFARNLQPFYLAASVHCQYADIFIVCG